MKKITRIGIFVVVLAIGIVLGAFFHSLLGDDDIFAQNRKYTQAFINVAKFYVDDVNSDKLTEAAIKGMLEELDPHSAYLPPKVAKSESERFSGNFDGIGVQFQIMGDTLMVVAPIFGGPSEREGVMAGDKIVKIDDSTAVGITNEEVVKRLRGPKGTKVKIKVVRAGFKELLSFTITRDKIPQNSVNSMRMITSEIGYIFISSFIATTHAEMVDAIKLLKSKGMKKLVLDLRGNPGGYLDQAIKVADEFLPEGKKIVYTKGRVAPEEVAYSTKGGTFETEPLLILINRGSASASEIVSGAVQDNDRGVIAGETSFGKGLVQRPFELQDGSQIRLTISRYYTPAGRSIQRAYKQGKGALESYYREAGSDKLKDMLNSLAEDSAKKAFKIYRGKPIESAPIVMKDTTHPKFKTLNGRIVLGAGGITPDYYIFSDSSSRYLIDLFAKAGNSFNEFAIAYLTANPSVRALAVPNSTKSQIDEAISAFEKKFQITKEMVKDLFVLIEKKGIKYNETEYLKEEAFYKNQIKANIARNIWGQEAYLDILISNDSVVKKSLDLFTKSNLQAKQ